MSEQTDTTDVNEGAEEQGAAVREGETVPGAETGESAGTGENYERASFEELGDGVLYEYTGGSPYHPIQIR